MPTIRSYHHQDDSILLQLLNQIELQPKSLDTLRETFRVQDENALYVKRVILEEESQIIGFGVYLDCPIFCEEGTVILLIVIDVDWRRRGLGTLLYNYLSEIVNERNPAAIQVTIKEGDPASKEWAEKRGFHLQSHYFEYVLKLQDWKREYHHLSALAEKRSYRSFYDLGEDWNRLFDLYARTYSDVPDSPHVNVSVDLFNVNVKDNQMISTDNIFIALDGDKWVGLTWLESEGTDEWYTGLTAVDKEYRNQGIGHALKIISINHAKSSGVSSIRTNNLSTNDRMLSINVSLGFVREPGLWFMKKQVQEVLNGV